MPQVIPGPPKYNGKYDAPSGQRPVVSDKDRGLFPPEFQAKYDAYKKKLDTYSGQTAKMVNEVVPGGKEQIWNAPAKDSSKLMGFYMNHYADGPKLDKEFETLKKEAINFGIGQ